jgi:hypothetical protein
VTALDDLVERHAGGRPYSQHDEHRWSGVIEEAGGFDQVLEERFDNPVATTVDGVLDRVRSISFVAVLSPERQSALLSASATLLRDEFGLTGTFDYPHHTVLDRCALLDA